MNNCITCQKPTKNPKFCSKSCAAKHNNLVPKRIKETTACIHCSKPTIRKQKFCSKACRQEHHRSQVFSTIAEGIIPNDKGYVNPAQVKKFLSVNYGHKCQICSTCEWQGKPLPLILDHIDGNSENWLLTNLRLICSNCDSQLPTYKARNRGNGRHARRKRYQDGLSY